MTLDYRPFVFYGGNCRDAFTRYLRYMTFRSRFPFGPALVTYEFTPLAEGARTALETRLLPGPGIRPRVLARLGASRMRSMVGGDLANLARLLAA